MDSARNSSASLRMGTKWGLTDARHILDNEAMHQALPKLSKLTKLYLHASPFGEPLVLPTLKTLTFDFSLGAILYPFAVEAPALQTFTALGKTTLPRLLSFMLSTVRLTSFKYGDEHSHAWINGLDEDYRSL